MTPFLQLALALVIIILLAKLGGYASYRLGQPSVLGELLVGVLLGPSVIDLLHLPYFTDAHLSEVVHLLAEIGVLLLMFIAGLGLHLSDLVESGKVAALAGVLGVLAPLLLGAGAGVAFGMDFQNALFLGLILAATSVSISAQTLIELNVLRSRVGIALLGSAVFDDILVILGLSLFVALVLAEGQGWISVLWIFLRMLIFLGVASAVGKWLLPRLSAKFYNLPVSQGLAAFTFITILLYGWAAEVIGHMAAITGAFLAGLWLAQSPLRERILNQTSVIAYAVFVPIFFVNIGLTANARLLAGESLWLLLSVVVVAVFSKIIGAGAGAWIGGFSRRESLQLGVGMMSRGEVGLIVANVGIAEGLISESVFAMVVGVVILTTLLTPPWLRALFVTKSPRAEREGEPS
jgi:Kef-type K+ transport system membrane component KefB